MSLLRDDIRQLCTDRQGRAEMPPARVALPLLSGTVAVVVSGWFAAWLALPPSVVAAVIAVTAVAAVVAVRDTLSSLAAGAGLLLARPYSPGEHVRVYVPCLDRVVEAEVVRVGAANTTLMTATGLVVLPNSVMLRGAPQHG
jgi:small-conductance mechanosensitive channel